MITLAMILILLGSEKGSQSLLSLFFTHLSLCSLHIHPSKHEYSCRTQLQRDPWSFLDPSEGTKEKHFLLCTAGMKDMLLGVYFDCLKWQIPVGILPQNFPTLLISLIFNISSTYMFTREVAAPCPLAPANFLALHEQVEFRTQVYSFSPVWICSKRLAFMVIWWTPTQYWDIQHLRWPCFSRSSR